MSCTAGGPGTQRLSPTWKASTRSTVYNENPEHQAILKISAPNIDQVIQVDFEY